MPVISIFLNASLNPSHVHTSPLLPSKCIPGFAHEGRTIGFALYRIRTKWSAEEVGVRKEGRKDAKKEGREAERKSSKEMWEVKGGQRESKTSREFLRAREG